MANLTPLLSDPVEALFGTQLGGGADINRAGCRGLIMRPCETIFVLISDLYEGGNNAEMLGRAPVRDGHPCFACTPDLLPDLMAAAIQQHSLEQWTSTAGIVRA